MPISSFNPMSGWSIADPSTVNSYAFANPNAIGPSPLAPNFGGGSTDPSMFSSNPYAKNLNQNVYAWQANQGFAPGFTQPQFDTNWGNFMMQGVGNNYNAFNQVMGTGTPMTGPGSSAGTGWNSTNFVMNPDGTFGAAPQQNNATLDSTNAFPQGGAAPGGNGGGVNTPTIFPTSPGGNYPAPGSVPAFTTAPNPLGAWPPTNAGGFPNYTAGTGFPGGGQFAGYANNTNSPLNLPAGAPNFLTPPTATTGPISPTQGPVAGTSPDTAMAGLPNDISYLRNIAQSGLPVNATPAWQAMIDAQSRQNQENAANLSAQFDVSGNRFGTAFGTSMTDFWNQVGLNQNALLGQMTMQSQSDAANRMLAAGTTLGGYGSNALSQLSSQGFQSNMAQNQAQLQAALAMLGYGAGAAGQIANISAGATGQLNSASTSMAQLMSQLGYGAAGQMYGGETQANLLAPQLQNQLQGLGIGAAGTMDQNWLQNLLGGQQIGMQQYGLGQQQIQNQYQEFLRTQPQYNPLLSMMYSGATGYPELAYPSFQQGQFGGIMSGAGAAMGGFAALAPLLGI